MIIATCNKCQIEMVLLSTHFNPNYYMIYECKQCEIRITLEEVHKIET